MSLNLQKKLTFQICWRRQIGVLCLLFAGVASAAPVSVILSDPGDSNRYYTINAVGDVAKVDAQLGTTLWEKSFPQVSSAVGGFAAAISEKFQLLAYCARRPISGILHLRLLHLATGDVYADINFNRSADGRLLASCHDVQFIDSEKIIVFNDVSRVHRISLRLQRITHTYRGAARHQVTAVSADQRTLVGLSDLITTWDFRSGRLLRRQNVYIPGYSPFGSWEIETAISPNGQYGFVIASEAERNKTALAWVNLHSGHLRGIYELDETASVTKIAFVDDKNVVAIVNDHFVRWRLDAPLPELSSVPAMRNLEFQWDGHEDVSINDTIHDPDQPIPVPPYPPEYTDVMTPHAYPLAITKSGLQAVGYFLRDGEPRIEFFGPPAL